MLVFSNYAKNYASTIYKSLGRIPHPTPSIIEDQKNSGLNRVNIQISKNDQSNQSVQTIIYEPTVIRVPTGKND